MTDIKQSARDLIDAVGAGQKVICIHYSCENFYDVTDRPVGVSAIGICELMASGERDSQVFSIASAAANDDVVEREKELLQRFFDFAKNQPDARWVHWNMNNATYGFAALISRHRFLFAVDPPSVFRPDRLYDLDSIIAARYGDQFSNHPKFRNLCSLNRYFMSFFKDGKEEARAYSDGDYGLVERSAGEKAHLLASLLTDFRSGALQTANSVGMLEFAGGHVDAVQVVLLLGERFLYVERELGRRYGDRATITINDEYDAQDLLRSLLAVFFDDVRPEDVAPSFAGASSRIDFVIPEYELAIELKFVRPTLDSKKLGEELIIDRDRYAQGKDIRHLMCLAFDHEGLLRNPRGLERDLSRDSSTDNFAVTVRIYDR